MAGSPVPPSLQQLEGNSSTTRPPALLRASYPALVCLRSDGFGHGAADALRLQAADSPNDVLPHPDGSVLVSPTRPIAGQLYEGAARHGRRALEKEEESNAAGKDQPAARPPPWIGAWKRNCRPLLPASAPDGKIRAWWWT